MEQLSDLPSLLQTCSEGIGLSFEQKHIDLFLLYLRELQTWNRSFNLTGITSDEGIIIKHFVDSLAAYTVEAIDPAARLLDVGTGAGFPGIPLKIARPDLTITLVEPSQKKASFLRFIIGRLQLHQTTLFDGTLAQYVQKHLDGQPFDYITTRALKQEIVLKEGVSLITKNGRAILYSSQPLDVATLDQGWQVRRSRVFQLPMGYGQRVISILSQISER